MYLARASENDIQTVKFVDLKDCEYTQNSNRHEAAVASVSTSTPSDIFGSSHLHFPLAQKRQTVESLSVFGGQVGPTPSSHRHITTVPLRPSKRGWQQHRPPGGQPMHAQRHNSMRMHDASTSILTANTSWLFRMLVVREAANVAMHLPWMNCCCF